jgi:hypothetical protein
LPSFHKKTLACFSDYSASSIAAGPLHRHSRLPESGPPPTNWLRGSFAFRLFYARNISVAPL